MGRIPRELRDAIEQRRCIPFIGAGASMDAVDAAGQPLPGWGQLLAELLNLIADAVEPDPPEVVEEVQAMLDSGDLMPVADWVDKRLGPARFLRHMIDRLATAQDSRVHEILSQKPFPAVMTTNYDRLTELHWAKAGRNPFVVTPQEPESIATARNAMKHGALTPIVRVHGGLADPSKLIFFPRTYRQIMFANEAFRQFMAGIFREYRVLFIGTSFRDPNMQSLLQWVLTVTGGQEAGHFAILDYRGPVFRHHMRENYNVEFITYDAPRGDHSALVPLLESL